MTTIVERGDGRRFITGLVLATIAFGILHLAASDVKAGGVYWFNLDKERNIPTWFSGGLFALFGFFALLIFHVEDGINRRARASETPDTKACFAMPELWLAVALVGFAMSLDEITVLHENLLWREVRTTTRAMGGFWVYMTQWQILYAPAIISVFAFFTVFFTMRLPLSPGAAVRAFCGLSFWGGSIFVEGIRELFLGSGRFAYLLSVAVEETAEMMGAVLLCAALLRYIADVSGGDAVRLAEESRTRVRFLSPVVLKRLGALAVALAVGATIMVLVARTRSSDGEKLPAMQERIEKEMESEGMTE
ncbi:MAG: hypothetical protein AAB229_06750 [Candidatus Hydrogenedentota bacterium]